MAGSTALDTARKQADEQEAKLRARDAAMLHELEAPTEELAAQYGTAATKIRSKAGRVAMDKALNAFRTAMQSLEAMTEAADDG